MTVSPVRFFIISAGLVESVRFLRLTDRFTPIVAALSGLSLLVVFLAGGFNPITYTPKVHLLGASWTVGWLSGRGPPPPLSPLQGDCVGLNGTFNASGSVECLFINPVFKPHLLNNTSIEYLLIGRVGVLSPFLVQSWGNISDYGCGCQTVGVNIELPSQPGEYLLTGSVWFTWNYAPMP